MNIFSFINRVSAKISFWQVCWFLIKILLRRVLIGGLLILFRRNFLNLLLNFLFSCLMLYNLIRLYANASKYSLIFCSYHFRWLLLFLFGIVLLIFSKMGPSTLDLLAYSSFIFLFFPFFGSLLFAFYDPYSVMVLCVCEAEQHLFRSLQFFYMLHNCCKFFLFCLVFLDLCVVQYIFQKTVNILLLGIWMHLIHNCIRKWSLYDIDWDLISYFSLDCFLLGINPSILLSAK